MERRNQSDEKDITSPSTCDPRPDAGSCHGVHTLESPFDWSTSRKWMVVFTLALMSLAGNLATIMCAPASRQILTSLGSDDQVYATLLVSIWELGEGVGPLIIAPISEVYGRRIAYNGANVAFVILNVLAAVSVDLPMLIVVRFFNGIAVGSVTLNPCVVGDLFVQEERGKAMSLMNLPALLGPVAGPIIGGYVAQGAGWRWVFGVTAIFAGLCAALFLVLFPETYHPAIIRNGKKASTSAEESGGRDGSKGSVVLVSIKRALVRPLRMLIFSPIVACLAIYASLAYGYIYILFTTMASTFQDQYRFSRGSAGLTYIGVGLGILIGVVICSMTMDRWVRMHRHAGRAMLPEQRLPFLVAGSVSIVAGFFLYGWSAGFRVQWTAPIVGTAFVGLGLVTTTISTAAYLVDAYPTHAASALAAVAILRSLAAAGLPLCGATAI